METNLGTLLHRYRLRAGMSQQDLATHAGVSVRGLRDLELGRVARPRAQSVQRLVAALELSAAERDLLLATSTGAPVAAPEHLQIGILGPLAVRSRGEDLHLRSAMVRDLLGLLAVQPNQLVPRHEIIDVLWGEDPPRTCVRLVHGYVGQLRELLDPGRARRDDTGAVRLLRGGYQLVVGAEALDLLQFEALLAAGEHADALDLWRGPALADAGERLRAHPAVVAAEQQRLAVVLADADARLDAGDFDAASARLRPTVADEPLHEGLAARLVVALAGSGEQAAALQLYGAVRERLAGELGIEPGPELADAQLRVLRGQIATVEAPSLPTTTYQVPAQLPPDVSAFTGRADQLARLDALLPEPGDGAVVIAPITGTAGVGKTALAIHWSHQVRARFPDGQLYVNLRGYASGPPLDPIDALARFLRALGVPAERVPTDADEAADLYRTLLANRRVLIVLDNAHSPEQVRPLLPGSPACLVLVTSRDALSGLVARDGARRLPVDVLTPDEAGALLQRLLGAELVAVEREAADELARLCAYLPLALRIAAANVIGEPGGTVAGYVARLRAGNRLAALEVEGDAQAVVRAALDLSYENLAEPARRLFRLLGLVPGPDFTAEVAAALTGATEPDAARLLAQLAHVHLIEAHQGGRYTFHDLLRLYASERAHDEEPAAAQRLFDFYLRGVDAAAGLLYPEKLRLPSDPSGPMPTFDHLAASAWLDAERANLLAVIRATASAGPHRVAWLLADGLRGYFFLRLSPVDWLAVGSAGLAAAQASGDVPAEAASELSLADLAWFRGDNEAAIRRYSRALRLAREVGWAECQAATLVNLGMLYRQATCWGEAIDHLTQALDLNRLSGRLAGQAVSLANLGITYWELGRLSAAADCYAQALDLYRQVGSRAGEATTIANLGEVLHLLGRTDDAREHLERALAMHREVGDRGNEAETLRCLAALHRDVGRYAEARAAADAALTLAEDTGHHRLEADTCVTLGSIHARLGESGRAVARFERALGLARDAAARHTEAQALLGLASVAEPAAGYARDALTASRQGGFRLLEGNAWTVSAGHALAAGRLDDAQEQAARAVEVHRETGHRLGLDDAERVLDLVAGE